MHASNKCRINYANVSIYRILFEHEYILLNRPRHNIKLNYMQSFNVRVVWWLVTFDSVMCKWNEATNVKPPPKPIQGDGKKSCRLNECVYSLCFKFDIEWQKVSVVSLLYAIYFHNQSIHFQKRERENMSVQKLNMICHLHLHQRPVTFIWWFVYITCTEYKHTEPFWHFHLLCLFRYLFCFILNVYRSDFEYV